MATYTLTDGTRKTQLTISGDTTVVFPTKLDYFGVRSLDGANILVSKIKAPTILEDGVYSTDEGDGDVVVDDGVFTDTLYLKGTGTVVVYGGAKSNHLPFKATGKGGGGSGGDNTHYKGTTTTAISNGSTTNPITIDGESYTAVFGDIVVYNYTEFVFDGTTWSEFGRPFDTVPTSGSANAVTSDGIYQRTPLRRGTGESSAIFGSPNNRATAANSVAKGSNTTASGNNSNAEGYNTTASGNNSHAEGNTAKASGSQSHAEGGRTTASGDYSHAGGFQTIANKAASTAIGLYNVADTNVEHLFIVGNGTAENARSNIVEVSRTEMNVNGDIKRDGVGIDDYTTTERKIGKWIDGSDLYQRTFEITSIVNDALNNDVLGTSGIKIINFEGLCDVLKNGNAYITTALNIYNSSKEIVSTWINSSGSDICIYPYFTVSGDTYTIDKAIITIKYTKPSVQANALNANIQQTEEPTDEMR